MPEVGVDPERGELARTHGQQPGLPRGRSSLPQSAVRQAQRERLVRAVVAAVAEHGYASVTVAEIVGRARVSRKAFYEQFPDKEACVLVALDEGVELMFGRIAEATRALPRKPSTERLRAALRAYLRFLADEPAFARIFLIEAFAAGPSALDLFVATQARFIADERTWHQRARREHRSWPKVPDDVHRALVGALHELVVGYVRDGRTADLPELEETAYRMHTTLYAGWDET